MRTTSGSNGTGQAGRGRRNLEVEEGNRVGARTAHQRALDSVRNPAR